MMRVVLSCAATAADVFALYGKQVVHAADRTLELLVHVVEAKRCLQV